MLFLFKSEKREKIVFFFLCFFVLFFYVALRSGTEYILRINNELFSHTLDIIERSFETGRIWKRGRERRGKKNRFKMDPFYEY